MPDTKERTPHEQAILDLARKNLHDRLTAQGVDPNYLEVELRLVEDRLRVTAAGTLEVRLGDDWRHGAHYLDDLAAELDEAVPAKWRSGERAGSTLNSSAERARAEGQAEGRRQREQDTVRQKLALS